MCLLKRVDSRKAKRGNGKVHPRTSHEGPEGEYRYSSTLSLTSALDGVGGGGQGHSASRKAKGMKMLGV